MIVKKLGTGSETWTSLDKCISCEIEYLVICPESKMDAIKAVLEASDKSYEGLARTEVRFNGWENDSARLIAVYAKEDVSLFEDENQCQMDFDCSGGTRHVTHAYEQIQVFKDGKSGVFEDDANGMIGWNGKTGPEADFAGVDVPFADMRITFKKPMAYSTLTSTAYMKKLGHLTGKTNSSTFKGWEPGELMFLGANYTAKRGEESLIVSFNFRAMPNEDDAKVAGKSIGKLRGCEYAWTRSETVSDKTSKRPRVKVKGIYKSSVVETADFNQLGL